MSENMLPQIGSSNSFDDDGRLKRTGTIWTASAHIITAVIGSGVLSLPWSVAQLGWVAGPIALLLFSVISYYTATLLADCYRTGDPVSGKRNYTYMNAVHSILGGARFKLCGTIQHVDLFGTGIGYTIGAVLSMMAIEQSSCLRDSGGQDPCPVSSNRYMIAFGVIQIVLSQIPNFTHIWWLSIVASIMSFTYSGIGLALGITKVAASGTFKGTLTGISVGTITEAQRMWRIFQALGNIAFAYSFALVLIEIQDVIKSPPAESKTMKKATLLSSVATAIFYMLCGCMGYAAFGDLAPGNLLSGFGYFKAFWILDIANAAIAIHLVGAYQVYCQPLFAFIEDSTANRWPDSDFITKEFNVPIPGVSWKLNRLRMVNRTIFVCLTTIISMLLPFFNDIVGILGAIGFWPLTVYFPIEMYIKQKGIKKWSIRWVCLRTLSIACLVVTLLALAGSIAGVVYNLKTFRPFKTDLLNKVQV
ncbi:amino acid permease 2-like [Punica granatum]|uniref:Amino acid transporter transmembrane domain-containing protein n=2 Tax=Punica granatum TaxID=22663 RepID=A0A218Y3W3_PUNGR|nr:amino acid permease 2-like [Punica granatum]OWM91501.1 hypothetical protein CDL15_Pgr017419 [Punica granatum]PKI66124.1 hypothetical protein CRG98_013482 [Punica granatum]